MSLELALSQILKLICIPLVTPCVFSRDNAGKHIKTIQNLPSMFLFLNELGLGAPLLITSTDRVEGAWRAATKLNKYKMSE